MSAARTKSISRSQLLALLEEHRDHTHKGHGDNPYWTDCACNEMNTAWWPEHLADVLGLPDESLCDECTYPYPCRDFGEVDCRKGKERR